MSTIYCESFKVHEEDQEVIEKLARLQSMYNKLFELRTLLPERLISPIKQAVANHHGARNVISPAILATQLRKVALQGTQEVQTFKKDWHSDEIRYIREIASSANYPQGDDAWRTDYMALARDLARSSPQGTNENGELESVPALTAPEDTAEVIKSFQQAHPSIRTEVPADTAEYLLDLRVGGIQFRVLKTGDADHAAFVATPKPGSKASGLSGQVFSFLETRKPEPQLSILLSTLASYHDLMTRPCDKCLRVFDDELQLALVKTPKSKTADTNPELLSFHRKCA